MIIAYTNATVSGVLPYLVYYDDTERARAYTIVDVASEGRSPNLVRRMVR